MAEVACVGGFVQQYQIDVDPNQLRGYGLPLSSVVDSVKRSNSNVGGNVIEQSGEWSVVRGVGLVESVKDIEDIVIGSSNGTPIYVRNVAEGQSWRRFPRRRARQGREGSRGRGGRRAVRRQHAGSDRRR